MLIGHAGGCAEHRAGQRVRHVLLPLRGGEGSLYCVLEQTRSATLRVCIGSTDPARKRLLTSYA
jgi:hypothetical protein